MFRSNGKNEGQKRGAVRDYLQQSRTLQQRFEEVIKMPPAADAATMLVLLAALKKYRVDLENDLEQHKNYWEPMSKVVCVFFNIYIYLKIF